MSSDALSPQRSPISVLQEESVKQNAMPEYQLVQAANLLYPFRYRVRVLGKVAFGNGRNKKMAKDAAAKAMLEIFPYVHKPPTLSQTLIDKNYIGLLQEHCVKNLDSLPQYSLASAKGPPHDTRFTFQVIVKNARFQAMAYTKKEAKTQVAKKAWESIMQTNKTPSLKVNTEPITKTKTSETFDIDSIINDFDDCTLDQRTSNPESDNETTSQEIDIVSTTESLDLASIKAKYLSKITQRKKEKRLFGKYHCKKCANKWASANSWENYYQECQQCLSPVYPYELSDLEVGEEGEKGGDEKPRKPHPQNLCQKCTELGSPCFEN